MAIGYTPQTWVNGSAPALSAANLQTMDNGINAACDALDAMAVDGTGIPDATTAIKGRVALATTGVEEATKVPKATGADLAALLTAGGYTLTAPSGANSLDGIADTATWKKVAAAVATALNADTYTANDADKVSAFGIGISAVSVTTAGTLDTLCTGGLYRVDSPTGLPAEAHAVLVVPVSSRYAKQFASSYVRKNLYIRNIENGVAGSWYEIFNASTDGNGGQPPAPKPRNSANNIGHWIEISNSTGAALNLPAGGKWAYHRLSFVTSSGAIAGTGGGADLAGGSELGAATSGVFHSAIIWRTE